ncbi:MAG: GtrA family protein [Glaciihabitans sp.]
MNTHDQPEESYPVQILFWGTRGVTSHSTETGSARTLKNVISWLYQTLLRYALKFGVVGLLGYVVDVTIFNALRLGAAEDPGQVLWYHAPLGAKFISVSVATLVTWFGNRYWTFREHRRQNFLLELLEFAVIAAIGLGISLFCLWVSHYVLGFTSLVADNISANVIGLVIATAFRFLAYRYWVYGPQRSDGLTARRNREAEELASQTPAA